MGAVAEERGVSRTGRPTLAEEQRNVSYVRPGFIEEERSSQLWSWESQQPFHPFLPLVIMMMMMMMMMTTATRFDLRQVLGKMWDGHIQILVTILRQIE